jgi:putative ABC transport system permease protein
MSPLLLLETALREIASHKFRSILSMLGIVLGVSSLIATMALTAGIEIGTRTFMEQLGGLEYVSVVNKEISGENFEFWNLSPGRTLMDAKILQEAVPLISHISPEMNHGAAVSAGAVSDRKQIIGVWPDHAIIGKHELAAGRFISDLDVDRATKVIVIGHEIFSTFFPGKQPAEVLGQTLLLNGSPFMVVGVLKRYERDQDRRERELRAAKKKPEVANRQARGRSTGRWDPFRRKNESLLIPLSTMFHEFKAGMFPLDAMESVRLDTMSLRVADLDHFRETLDQVRSALMVTHRGVDDFELETREEWFDRMESSIAATRLSGGLIAAISLIVGGIGITNIMLASITERVREIGIRMAVGARGSDIFFQILVESVSIALIGGLIGIAAGVGLIEILVRLAPSDNVPVIEASSIILSVAFAVVAGIVSGLYPALRASKLEPISALRYE